jgi:hypothetical protein
MNTIQDTIQDIKEIESNMSSLTCFCKMLNKQISFANNDELLHAFRIHSLKQSAI